MGERTGIAWTSSTWNPIRGCSRVSEGCRNCYAERVAARFTHTRPRGNTGSRGVPVENGPFAGFATSKGWTGRVELVEKALLLPLRWRKPRRIFVNSMSDLFHENLPDEAIDRVFAVMALSPRHTFQILTKRAERMRKYLTTRSKSAQPWKNAARTVGYALEFEGVSLVPFPLPNVWLGVSAEDQKTADERIPLLLQTPAAVRFVSAEPLLEAVDLTSQFGMLMSDEDGEYGPVLSPGLSWVITGGESGPGARPCDIAWIRSIVQQCKAAGVPCFVKQMGARPIERPSSFEEKLAFLQRKRTGPVVINADGANLVLRDRKGADPAEWPEDLRVQEFPR